MTNRRAFFKAALLPAVALSVSPGFAQALLPQAAEKSLLSKLLKAMHRTTPWKEVAAVPIQFPTFHCQGMVKIGAHFWVSSVEVSPKFVGDRSTGQGHLFQLDAEGKLLAHLLLGEGSLYHPSGIDFDGLHIWIALAAYKPNSQSIVYQVDPAQLTVKEVFRWEDHLGAVAFTPDTQELHGANWGSRHFYQWQAADLKKLGEGGIPTKSTKTPNPSNYIDYQDNQYLGAGEMLYSGLATYKKPGGQPFALGGIDLIDLTQERAVHQLPIPLWSPKTGAPMTQNPCFFEALAPNKVRGYFIPDDNESTLYIYEAAVNSGS
jgi:hypothetical protein